MHPLLHSVPPNLQQATADPHLCQRLLDTHVQVWVSLLCGHCSFLLGPGVHKILVVPSKHLFPQSCVSSGSSIVGLMGPAPRGLMPYTSLLNPEPLSLWQATADPYLHRRHSTQFCLSLCRVSGSWCTQSLFELSGLLWQEWGLILNVNLPLLPSCWRLLLCP